MTNTSAPLRFDTKDYRPIGFLTFEGEPSPIIEPEVRARMVAALNRRANQIRRRLILRTVLLQVESVILRGLYWLQARTINRSRGNPCP